MTILRLNNSNYYFVDGMIITFDGEYLEYTLNFYKIDNITKWLEVVDDEVIEIMKAIKELSDEYNNKANRDYKDLA